MLSEAKHLASPDNEARSFAKTLRMTAEERGINLSKPVSTQNLLDTLKKEIEIGLAQVNRGEATPLDMKEIMAEGRKMLLKAKHQKLMDI